MILPKIIYPSTPSTPASPATGQSAGGSIAATTYYIIVTFSTLYGESLPCAEVSQAVLINHVLTVSSPVAPIAPTYATGWNVYVGLTPGSETLQSSNIAIGTGWTEPTSGLISGSIPPSTWGATLSFTYQPRLVPYSDRTFIGKDTLSTAGWRQSVVERLDKYLNFDMEWLATGSDVAGWDSFIVQALNRVPFDYYPDATALNYTTYALVEINQINIPYKVPGRYTVSMRFRQETPQISNPVGVSIPPINSVRTLSFTTVNPGNFTVAHNLGYVPLYVGVPKMISAGMVWFQPLWWDDTYIYLVASDGGLSGTIGVS